MNVRFIHRSKVIALALIGAAACGSPSRNNNNDQPDLTPAPVVDLAGDNRDLSRAPDMANAADLAVPVDMTVVVEPDLSVPADLAMNPTDDMDLVGGDGGSGPVNATCAGAIPVTHNSTVAANTTGATESLHTLCRNGARGGVLYYSITLQPSQRLTATVTPVPALDAVVRILDGCAATSCLAFADAKTEGQAETATYTNSTMSPRPVIIAISSYNEAAPGALGLAVAVENVPTNFMCSTPVTVANGTSLTGQDLSVATDTLSSACVSSGSGKVLYYQATVPAGQQLKVTVVAQSSWDPVIRILSTCGVSSCVASSDSSSSSTETLQWPNNKTTPQTVLIAVGAYSSTTTATFNMAVEIAAAQICGTATPITTLPATLTGQDFSLGSAAPCAGSGLNRYYRVNVPNGSILRAVLTPSSSYDSVIRLIDGTCPSSCITSQDSGYSGDPETLIWENTGATRDVVLAMGGYSVSSGAFNASVAVTPAPTNTTCANATVVTASTNLYAGQDTARGTAGPSCVGNGENLYWKVTVPVNNTLRVVATPNTEFNTAIRLIDESCPGSSTSTCIASADAQTSSTTPESLTWKNTGASDRTVIVGVGRRSSSTSASFQDISIEMLPPPANSTCAQATPVTSGTSLSNQSPAFALNSLNSVCIGPATGKVLFYSVTLQPGQTLNAMATPGSNWDPVIRVLHACTDTSCVASADNFASGASEVLMYTNGGSDPEDLIIAVGSYDENVTGNFTLAVQVN